MRINGKTSAKLKFITQIQGSKYTAAAENTAVAQQEQPVIEARHPIFGFHQKVASGNPRWYCLE